MSGASLPTDINEIMEATGGNDRLENAVQDAMDRKLQSGIVSQLFDGQQLDDQFAGDAGAYAKISGVIDVTTGSVEFFLDSAPGGLANGPQVLQALDGLNGVAGALDNLQDANDLGGIPGALLNLANAASTAAGFLKGASAALSAHPAGLIPGAGLGALAAALEVIAGDIQEEIKALTNLLKDTLDGRHSFENFDVSNPETRRCIEEIVEQLERSQEKDEEQDDTSEEGNNPDQQGPAPKDDKTQDPDPLVIDLDGDGVELTERGDPFVFFGYEGDGSAFSTGWVSPDDALVVRDANGNNNVDSAEEFFGDETIDAFSDLATFDLNGDLKIDANDAVWAEMRVWQDLDQDGRSTADELRTMDEAGIVSISLNRVATDYEYLGNTVLGEGTYQRADGQVLEAMAVAFEVTQGVTRNELPEGFSYNPAVRFVPDLEGGANHDLWFAMTVRPDLLAEVQNLVDIADLATGAEFRQSFEDMMATWLGTSNKKAMLETYFGQEINYVTEIIDIGLIYTPDVRLDLAYEAFMDSMQLRFAVQLPGLALLAAEDQAAIDAVAKTSFWGLHPLEYNLETDEIAGWIGYPVLEISRAMPEDGVEAFAFLDRAMPALRALRDDYYTERGPQTTFAPHFDNQQFNFDLRRAVDQVFDDPMLGDFAYYRTLSSNVVFGTAADQDLTFDKAKSVNSLNRDHTYVFGMEGDDFFASKPYIGPIDPSNPGSITITGNQQSTVFLYRAGDGDDTIDFSQSSGVHRVYLPDINKSDAVFQVAATGGGDAVLTFAQGGSITFASLGSLLAGSLKIWFADGGVLTEDDVRLQFTDGNDVIVGTDLDDVLFGGLGNDELRGGDTSDVYIYRRGDGHDTIHENWIGVINGPEPVDRIVFEDIDSTELIIGRGDPDQASTDIILTFEGSPGDSITLVNQLGARGLLNPAPAPKIEELEFADGVVISWEQVAESAFVGELTDGDDTVEGTRTHNTLFFSNGNDTLSGLRGDDTYIRQPGVLGDDTIEDGGVAGDFNRLILEAINPGDVTLSFAGNDVTLTLPDGSVKIVNQRGTGGANVIDEVEFADGTIWSSLDIAAMLFPDGGTDLTRTGTPGGETINGNASDETIDSLGGDDTMNGRGGSDVYIYGTGYGNDEIREGGDLSSRSVDRVKFTDLNPGDVELTRLPGNDLVVTILATGETLTIDRHFRAASNAMEFFEFADGTVWGLAEIAAATVWRGTAGDDDITASGDVDTIDGGTGNDILRGQGNGDTYVFDVGDGADQIIDNQSNDPATVNVVHIRGIGPAEFTFERETLTSGGDDAILRYGAGDSIRLVNQYNASPLSRPIQQIRFDDGTIIQADDLLLNSEVFGTAGDDDFGGSTGDDIIDALAGDDALRHSVGDDTYIWGVGKGSDVIHEFGDGEAENRVRLEGLAASDVTFLRENDGDDLIITIVATGETLRVVDQFRDPLSNRHYGVAELVFDGGEVIDRLGIVEAAPILGTAAAENLNGGRGDDAYVWGTGRGDDVIDDTGRIDEIDTVILENLNPDDVTLSRAGGTTGGNGYDLAITIDATGETLLLEDQLHFTSVNIETLVFADGTRLDTSVLPAQLPFVGTAADEELAGDAEDNILEGRAGADLLNGSFGGDIYRWQPGDGDDVIAETRTEFIPDPGGGGEGEEGEEGGGEIEIQVPLQGRGDVLDMSLVDRADVRFERAADDPTALLLVVGPPAGPFETIRVEGQFHAPWVGIETFQFADATLSYLDVMALIGGVNVVGSAAGEEHVGTWTADTFAPGEGDDTIRTNGGNDLIVIDPNSGIDTVEGFVGGPLGTQIQVNGPALAGFGAFAATFQNTYFADFQAVLAAATQIDADVEIDLGNGNRLILKNTSIGDIEPENFGFARAPLLGSADADNLTGTALSDVIRGGAGDDIIRGRKGADSLFGDEDDDTFIVTPGDGSDTIDGGEGTDTVVVDGAGRVAADLAAGTLDVDGVLSLLSNVENVTTGGGDDDVTGDGAANEISTDDGNDRIEAAGGDDTTDGGAGSDDYVFGFGDGSDIIRDEAGEGDVDRLLLRDGVLLADLNLRKSVLDLIVELSDGSQVTVANHFIGDDTGIEQIVLADGTILDRTAIAFATVVPTVSIEADGDGTFVEGMDAVFNLILSEPVGKDIEITVALDLGGTADASDFDLAAAGFPASAPFTRTVSVPSGQTTVNLQIPVLVNDDPVDQETFSVSLVDDPGGSYLLDDTASNAAGTLLDPPNEVPLPQDDAFATAEDAPVSGNVLDDNGNGADTDPDGDILTVTELDGEAADIGQQITLASGALLTLQADGAFTYDPNGQFDHLNDGETATDGFAYTVDDGNGGTATASTVITVEGADDAVPTISLTKSAEIIEDSDNGWPWWSGGHHGWWGGFHGHHGWWGGWHRWWWKRHDDENETDIRYTLEVRNTSEAPGDSELTLTALLDDNATPGNAGDDFDVLAIQGAFAGGDTDGDGKVDVGEVWTYQYTMDGIEPGTTLTNSATAVAVNSDGEAATDTAEVMVETPLPTEVHHARWGSQRHRGEEGVRDIFELKAEHRGIDKIRDMDISEGDALDFDGWILNRASVEDGSLQLKGHRNGDLTIWANRDWDRRLEKVAVLKDFLDDNEDALEDNGLDPDALRGRLDRDEARTLLELIVETENDSWV